MTIPKDCIHDLFEDLFHYRATVGSTDNILFYLYRSLNHIIVRNQKKRHKTIAVNDDLLFEKNAFYEQDLDREISRHQRHRLRKALNQLPERQKEAMYLHYVFDLNNREIAQFMDINYQTVRNILHMATDNLRKIIPLEEMI